MPLCALMRIMLAILVLGGSRWDGSSGCHGSALQHAHREAVFVSRSVRCPQSPPRGRAVSLVGAGMLGAAWAQGHGSLPGQEGCGYHRAGAAPLLPAARLAARPRCASPLGRLAGGDGFLLPSSV